MGITQTNGERKVKDSETSHMMTNSKPLSKFEAIEFSHILQMHNRFADALAKIASMIEILVKAKIIPLLIEQRNELAYGLIVVTQLDEEELPRYVDIWNFTKKGAYL